MASASRLVPLALALTILAPGAGQGAPQDDDGAEALQQVLGEHPGPASLEGLCVLPETHAAFAAAVPAAAHPPGCDVAADLTPGQQEAVVGGVTRSLRTLDAGAQRRFVRRLGGWITALQQLAIAERLSSAEEVMAAAYSVPRTRSLFKEVIANRREPGELSPRDVGATLASEEHAQLRRAIATRLSALDLQVQLEYYDDLLTALLKLRRATGPG